MIFLLLQPKWTNTLPHAVVGVNDILHVKQFIECLASLIADEVVANLKNSDINEVDNHKSRCLKFLPLVWLL